MKIKCNSKISGIYYVNLINYFKLKRYQSKSQRDNDSNGDEERNGVK